MWEGRAECGHERPARASPERTLAKIFNELKVLICSELAAASVPASAAGRARGTAAFLRSSADPQCCTGTPLAEQT